MSQRCLMSMLAAIAVTACGSGGGGEEGDPGQAGALQLSAATQSVNEGAGTITVTVTRTGGSDGAVTAALATSNGVAIAGQDFTAISTSVSFAAGDSAAKSVSIPISNDALEEPAEAFTVTLSAPTGGATLGTPASATITIQDNDTTLSAGNGLNDTGVTTCSNGASNGVACNDSAAGTDEYPDQDGEGGRDFSNADDADGHAGFSFTKLDATGAPLANQQAAFGSTPWDCVRDNVTGLTWEVKTDDGNLRDRDWTYTWYISTGINTRLSAGVANGGSCANATDCDTEKYVTAVNAARLCGQGDWRVPTRAELLSIVNYGAAAAPLVDSGYFPNAATNAYWSASPDQLNAVWSVDFANGNAVARGRSNAISLRLVRQGP
jgi:hypothetical protein